MTTRRLDLPDPEQDRARQCQVRLEASRRPITELETGWLVTRRANELLKA